MLRSILLGISRLLAVMLVASLAGAVLLRAAPGFSSDARELDPALSSQSVEAIRQEHLAQSNIARFYAHYLGSLARGDLGRSLSLNQPVSDLLRDRLPVTLRALGLALVVAWVLGLSLATASHLLCSSPFKFLSEGLSGILISTPAAAVALVFVLLRLPPTWAAALLVFPKIYRYAANLLQEGSALPHVITARARGAGRARIFFRHVAPVAAPQFIALLGVSISIAIGVLLPIEVICDVPGIGQLAWQAAQSRDLPLLVNLTLIVTFLTVAATTLSSAAKRGPARELGMKALRVIAISALVVAGVAALSARQIAPAGYERQFRAMPDAGPSAQHPLGTDDLGRDRLARLLYGMRVSFLLAPLAAFLATLLAAALGGVAGCFGGWVESGCMFLTDLFLSVPWLFLLITVRAMLPLDIAPETSAVVTFLLLGLLGWAASARVVCAGVKSLMKSEFVWSARAAGFSGFRLARLHLLPNLRGTLLAQFWISVPVFIIAEANLGALGLGVSEPLPSLGSLLREMQSMVMLRLEAWRFVPILVLIVVVSSFQALLSKSPLNREEARA